MTGVDNEKIESMKSDFLALHILFNHPIEVQNCCWYGFNYCLFSTRNSFLFGDMNCQKWDFAHILYRLKFEEKEEIFPQHLKLSRWTTAT